MNRLRSWLASRLFALAARVSPRACDDFDDDDECCGAGCDGATAELIGRELASKLDREMGGDGAMPPVETIKLEMRHIAVDFDITDELAGASR